MTAIIFAISVRVARLATLVAGADDVLGNSLPQPFIKNEIFADEFIFETLIFYLSGIFDNATL